MLPCKIGLPGSTIVIWLPPPSGLKKSPVKDTTTWISISPDNVLASHRTELLFPFFFANGDIAFTSGRALAEFRLNAPRPDEVFEGPSSESPPALKIYFLPRIPSPPDVIGQETSLAV